jgi:hypothetical protein
LFTMKLCIKIFTAAIAISQGAAFQTQQFGHQLAADRSSWRQRSSPLFLSTPSDDDVLRIMKEESMDPATLAESAERMKSMTPEVCNLCSWNVWSDVNKHTSHIHSLCTHLL